MAKVMFSSLSVGLCVCMSVCLLATSRKTAKRISMTLSGYVGFDTRNKWEHFQDVSLNPLNTGIFSTFFKESMPLSNTAEKCLNVFPWNCQKRTNMTQGAIGNIFGMLRLTTWILGRFIYFLDPPLFVILCKKGWMDFHDLFMERQARHKK